MAYQSETALENEVIQQLVRLGYEKVSIHSVEEMHQNLRNLINERHMDKLGGVPLTDSEFDRLMTDINGKTVFDSALQLRDKYVLRRDDETTVYIELLNTRKWCQNKFQVTNQIRVSDKFKGRYDVTLLINGLPLVQIELKRSGVAITEAFNQIKRYRQQNFTGLFRFIQLFVVSNKMETRYFANSDKDLYKSHMFYWSDAKNERINYLKDFVQSFLEPCHIAKMISRYMIVNETDKILMALRPYQVYAVEALLNRALETNNNGYIWHTTGSGKTLTSFKASQLLSQEEDIKKVIFLVDRKDLDSQTLSEFNKFQDHSVDLTENTRTLLKQLGDTSLPLIVTTIQKMSNAVKSGAQVMDRYKEDKVIFIIDECHRTQFGSMHREIRNHFKNAQYFGFTGTPRFEENKSKDGRATADIFETCLHHYLIKDAIRDGNVLGFSVEYHKTFDPKDEIEEEYLSKINTKEIWEADKRMKAVAEHIIDNYQNKTNKGHYTTMFAVQTIPSAVKYYSVFKKLKEEGKHDLNVTTIFSYRPNEETNDRDEKEVKLSREVLEDIMKDYNQMFGTNYNTENYEGYFADISKKMKAVKPGEKIDILIIVNMFLTGFDSKKLNTLYVDKNLKHHDLIQAYSRTNRVEKETKPYGNIVCYRDLKKETDEAIEIFSQTNDTDTVLGPSYDEFLSLFREGIERVYTIVPTPNDASKLEREDDKKAFVLAFRHLVGLLVCLKSFDRFEFTREVIGIDQQTFVDYKGVYLKLYDEVIHRDKSEGESVLDDIDFKIELLRNDLINVQYILDLIASIDLSDQGMREKQRSEIHQLLDKADNEQLRLKADLIRSFLDEVIPTLSKDEDISEAYYDYEAQEKEKEIKHFAENNAYPFRKIKVMIGEYEYSGILNRGELRDGIPGGLLVRRKKANEAEKFIKHIAFKYGNIE